jgi:hypothetical protein
MTRCALLSMGVVVLLGGCKSSVEPPDPSTFKEFEKRPQADPRGIVFKNSSVEMAALEIFVPKETPKDCHAEAPHRLLCPADYRCIFDERVFPRKQAVVTYPEALSLDCAQVWVRVHSKAMGGDEFREAIFLPPSKDRGLSLELGEGEAARLEQADIETKNQFPPPIRYCAQGDGDMAAVPEGTRSDQEVERVIEASAAVLDACCKNSPCRGLLKASLTLHRDGRVLRVESISSKGKVPEDCLAQALSGLRFSGFTAKLTRAEIAVRLPRGR